jgi:F-type H+-transporting ATPase subunit b
MENFPHPPTIILVGAAVVALVFILNRWLFGPLSQILEQRQNEIDAARAAFDEAQAKQSERLDAVEARVAESRNEAFAIREEAHNEAREHRDRVIADARDEAAQEIEGARAEIKQQIDDARTQLEKDADSLARSIAERVLGRPVDADGGKE